MIDSDWTAIRENIVEIADGVRVRVQRQAIISVPNKGG